MFSEPSVSCGPVIDLAGVSKFYPVNPTPRSMLRYLLPWPLRSRTGDLWALRDVSLTLERGTVLGVIGRNGSGKSTLLQVVAGLLAPSRGRVRVRGRTAALIELGAGFNPEFTGRENVMLSGAIYGYGRELMRDKFDRIVEFSELEAFIDRPVKTYSSGMYARLAFSVAIMVDPDVLLVDEILSVGDLDFQAKCFQRIETLKEGGTSILFVSHNLSVVQTLSDRVVLLEEGRVAGEGPPVEITDLYLHRLSLSSRGRRAADDAPALPDQRVSVGEVTLCNSRGEPTSHPSTGERCTVRYRATFNDDVERPVFSFQLKTLTGLVVFDQNNLVSRNPLRPCRRGEAVEVTVALTVNLCPGPYRIGIGIADLQDEVFVPIFGDERLAVEVISDRSEAGIASCGAEITFSFAPRAEKARDGG